MPEGKEVMIKTMQIATIIETKTASLAASVDV